MIDVFDKFRLRDVIRVGIAYDKTSYRLRFCAAFEPIEDNLKNHFNDIKYCTSLGLHTCSQDVE